MKVNFFIIGAQRSGTTFLYKLLEQHPQIALAKPVRPEPKFFIDEQQHQLGEQWYLDTYFSHRLPHSVLGEKSTSYLEYRQAAERIHQYNPQARILVMLRNPIDRAFSNYRFSLENGLETLSFSEALTQEPARLQSSAVEGVSVSPFAYATRGCYINYLNCYLEYFPKDQIKIILTENLIEDAAQSADIFQFLGVKPYASQTPGIVNASANPHLKLDPAQRSFLESFFAPFNKQLASQFQLDLTCWNC